MVAAGLEHPPLEHSKTAISTSGGAKSGAPDAPNAPHDPDLVLVVERWPELPAPVKAGILAMVQAYVSQQPSADAPPSQSAQADVSQEQ